MRRAQLGGSSGCSAPKEAYSALQQELVRTFQDELAASSLLEHWARLLLTLANCTGNESARINAAAHVLSFQAGWSTLLLRLDPGCVHRLLASSPCLSYLLISQPVALCAALDGGTVYGMPEAPSRVLSAAALAPSAKDVVSRVDAAVEACKCTLRLVERMFQGRLRQAENLAAATSVAADGSATGVAAGGLTSTEVAEACAAGAEAEEAVRAMVAEAAHERGANQTGRVLLRGAEMRRDARPSAPTSGTVQRADRPPLLLDATVCLEVSLRLTTALCGWVTAAQAGSAHAQAGGGTTGRRLPPPPALKAANAAACAQRLARQLLVGTRSAAAGLRPRKAECRSRSRDRDRDAAAAAAGSAGAGASSPSQAGGAAGSPLERWWVGAVALGEALAAIAAAQSAAAQRGCKDWKTVVVGELVDRYFVELEAIALERCPELPPRPNASVAAALSAGFPPCLERLLRAVLPLGLDTMWDRRLGPLWDGAWAQMLAFAEDTRQTTGAIEASVESLRRALTPQAAAAAAGGGGRDGDGAGDNDIARLLDAAYVATRLDGSDAMDWLPGLAGKLEGPGLLLRAADSSGGGGGGSACGTAAGSKSSAPAKHTDAGGWGGGAGGAADGGGDATCETAGGGWGAATHEVAARLGGSLSLITTQLLPELSRALLGGVFPAVRRGAALHADVCFLLARQLYWVPQLAAALAAELLPKAAAADAGAAATEEGAADGAAAGGSGGGAINASGNTGGGGGPSPRAHRWRQLLFVELRLPGLLGAALSLSVSGVAEKSDGYLSPMYDRLREAMWALIELIPAELARMVAAADRAEAAAAGGRAAAAGRSSAASAAPLPPPPSSGLLRRALGPGGPLEDAELLAAVEAACAGGVGRGTEMPQGEKANVGLPPGMKEELLLGARLLSLRD